MAKVKCDYCGTKIRAGWQRCEECGGPLPLEIRGTQQAAPVQQYAKQTAQPPYIPTTQPQYKPPVQQGRQPPMQEKKNERPKTINWWGVLVFGFMLLWLFVRSR